MRLCGLLVNWIGQDLRFAVRLLLANKQSTILSILTLAVGLGATSAAFKAAHAWLIRPLPVMEPARLVRVEVRHVRGTGARYREFLDLRAQNQVFEELAIVTWSKASLADRDGAVAITTYRATVGTPRVLGIHPTLGRFFNETEDSSSGSRVALVSESTWARRFGRRTETVGSIVTINEHPHIIIGVMPDRAAPPGMPTSDFWLPLRENPAAARIGQQYGPIFGRLKPGVTLDAARAHMDGIARAIEQAHPDSTRNWQVRLIGARAFIREEAFVSVVALFAIALCLLLLVCVNVAGMLLARASSRVHELAVRAALGASRWRIIRQLLTESTVLGLLAGAGGVLVSNWVLRAGVTLVPNRGLEGTLRVDGSVLIFSLGLSILIGLLIGMSSAFQASRAQLGTTLQSSASRTLGPLGRGRLLSSLVVLEIAVSLVLLVGGGLLTRDVVRLLATDTGVRTDVVTFRVELPGRYASAEQRGSYLSRMVDRLRGIPAVDTVAAVEALPMSGFKTAGSFTLGTDWVGSRDSVPRAILNAATPGYFETIGIPLLYGRDFVETPAARPPSPS